MNEVYDLRRDYEDTEIPYKLQVVGTDSPELLTDGLFLFHNPFARNKLDIGCFEDTSVTQFFWKENKLLHTSNTYPIVCRLNISRMLQPGFEMLVDEYLRQYNNFTPMEYYSLDKSRKVIVDFDKDCLVCIWVKLAGSELIRNIHYVRSQSLSDEHLIEEVKKIIEQRTEEIEEIARVDIIRNRDMMELINS